MPHVFVSMKPCIVPVCVDGRPIRRHPACPAELTEPPEPDGLDRAHGNGQFSIPIELLAIVEEYKIDQRLAQVAGWQEAHVLCESFSEYANPDFI